jgi:hypothetical protein
MRLQSLIIAMAVLMILLTSLSQADDAKGTFDIKTQTQLNRQSIQHQALTIDEIKTSLASINCKLEKLMNRPSWVVCVIITSLTGLCTGLLVKGYKNRKIC